LFSTEQDRLQWRRIKVFHDGFPVRAARRSGRLIADKKRSQFGWAHAVFQPKLMTADELERGVQRMYDELYPYLRRRAMGAIMKRLGLLWRHPALARIFVTGMLGHAHVAEEETV
jgi:hypothetical protein